MKKYYRRAISFSLLSVLLLGLVFMLTGCGLFGQKPTAEISTDPPLTDGKVTANVGDDIVFSGENSEDPDGTITSYDWEFGDGQTASGEVQTHSYTSADTYTVTLTVTDDSGKPGNDSVEAEISS